MDDAGGHGATTSAADHHDASTLPLASLPDYTIMRILTYFEGLCKPISNSSSSSPHAKSTHRPKLVVSGAADDDWYHSTKLSSSPSSSNTAELRSRWTALCAMRLTCRRFARLSAHVVPMFSLFRMLKANSIPIGIMSTGVELSETIGSAQDSTLAIPLVTATERRLVADSEVSTGWLRPHMFRSKRWDGKLSSLISPMDPESEDEFRPLLPPISWFGSLALQVHRSFEPLVLPAPHEAPLTCLQVVVSAKRHECTLSHAIPPAERVAYLVQRTTIDYSIDKWKRYVEEDGEIHMRFRLQVSLDGDDGYPEGQRPIRMLNFKSVLTQSASCARPRTALDQELDPLNLSPFFLRKSTSVATHLPLHVGLHMIFVETEDPELARQLGIPGPTVDCSTITTIIETGARGILEAATRPNDEPPPYVLHRSEFYLKLAALVGFAVDTPQDAEEAVKDILRWVSAHSLVDYTNNRSITMRRSEDEKRMYSFSFLRHESPVDGPFAPSEILNMHSYLLDPEIGRFLRLSASGTIEAATVQATHLKTLFGPIAHSYYRSIEMILEQYRLTNIVIPRVQELAKAELDPSLIEPLARLCSRLKIVDQVEVEFQVLEQTTPTVSALELVPIVLHSTFDLQTNDPNIVLRFSHRRYPMAIALSIVAPSVLEAWQWAAKHRVMLSYFHYGCSPFYVAAPDLSHLSKRRPLDVFTVNLLPTVEGAPLPSWTSDPLITNSALASTSVNSLEDLESRDGVCFFRWDPSVKLDDWRQTISPNLSGLPIDVALIETLTANLGVPDLTCNQFMTILIRVFGQCMGRIPSVPHDTSVHLPIAASALTFARLPSAPKNYMQALKATSSSVSAPVEIQDGKAGDSSSEVDATRSQYKSRFEGASPISSNGMVAPFGTSRANWKATAVREGAVGSSFPETACSYLSINMLPAYSEVSYEQLRWMDYNILDPMAYGIAPAPKRAMRQLHPSNVFVDPIVVGTYPDMKHRIHYDDGYPCIAFMSSGDRYVLLQVVESVPANRQSTTHPPNMPSTRSSREQAPIYDLNHPSEEFASKSDKAQYCVVLRRGHTSWFVSAHMDLATALHAFSARFSNFTGQRWSPETAVSGWTVAKIRSTSGRFDPDVQWIPSDWLQPTFLDHATFYEHIPLTGQSNELLLTFAPVARTLRYFARFYRVVQADLPNSLYMIKLALLNDERGTDDRIASLVEFGEWSRASGDVKATIDAIDTALLVDASHPLPWIAKADMMNLASLQASDTRAELRYIEYSLMLYRRYLTCAQRVHTLNTQHNPSSFVSWQHQSQASQSTADSHSEERQDTEANGGAAAAAGARNGGNGGANANGAAAQAPGQTVTNANPLLAQTPSLTPPSLLSLIMHQNPNVPFITATPSPVHMRRAKWAVGKLLHRVGRYEEAKACYDDLLRKYFKRERLELTLDRCAVLLSLGKPKEAADTIDHALKKEGTFPLANIPNPFPRAQFASYYWNHYRVLKSRAYLLLSASCLRIGSVELAAIALRDHRVLEVVEPRASILERVLRNARLASKPDTRTRMRQHGMQVLQQMMGQPDPNAAQPHPPPQQPQQLQVQPPQANVQALPNVAHAPAVPPALVLPGAAHAPNAPAAAVGGVLAPAAAGPVPALLPGGAGPAMIPVGVIANRPPNMRRRRRHAVDEGQQFPDAVDSPSVDEAVLQFEMGLVPGVDHQDPTNANRMEIIIPPLSGDLEEEEAALAAAVAEAEAQLLASPNSHPASNLRASSSATALSSSAPSSSDSKPRHRTSGAMQVDGPVFTSTGDGTPRTPRNNPEATPPEVSLESALDEVGEAEAATLSAVPRSPASHRSKALSDASISAATSSVSPLSRLPVKAVQKTATSLHDSSDDSSSSTGRSSPLETSGEFLSHSLGNMTLDGAPNSPSPTSGLANKMPTNLIALRRALGPRVYAPWEFYSSLLDRMIDLSAMIRRLLFPVLFRPLGDASWIPFSVEQLQAAREILRELKATVAEAQSAKPVKSQQEYQRAIFDLEDRYFTNMPEMRRHHISFFVNDEIRRIDQLLDATFSRDLLIQAMSRDPRRASLFGTSRVPDDAESATHQPLSFAERFVQQIFRVSTPPDSSLRQYTVPTALRSSSSMLNLVSYDSTDNLNTPFPTRYFVELLAEQVLFSVVDKRSTKGAQLLNAIGHVLANELRIISVTRVHPPLPAPELAPNLRWRRGPSTLLWIAVPSCSLARVLLKGIFLEEDREQAYLDLSAAVPANFAPNVALLVEVRLGALFYCGPEQTTLPSGFDSLAIVNRFSSFQEDDDEMECLIPNHSDSSAALFRIFHQDQIGAVRYIVYM